MFHVSTKLPFTEGDVQQVQDFNTVTMDLAAKSGSFSSKVSILNRSGVVIDNVLCCSHC